MSIIGWIIIGGLAGALAGWIMNEKGGILRNIIIGVIGAFIGGFVMNLIGGQGFTGFNIWSFVVALVGAIILIFLGRLIFPAKKRR